MAVATPSDLILMLARRAKVPLGQAEAVLRQKLVARGTTLEQVVARQKDVRALRRMQLQQRIGPSMPEQRQLFPPPRMVRPADLERQLAQLEQSQPLQLPSRMGAQQELVPGIRKEQSDLVRQLRRARADLERAYKGAPARERAVLEAAVAKGEIIPPTHPLVLRRERVMRRWEERQQRRQRQERLAVARASKVVEPAEPRELSFALAKVREAEQARRGMRPSEPGDPRQTRGFDPSPETAERLFAEAEVLGAQLNPPVSLDELRDQAMAQEAARAAPTQGGQGLTIPAWQIAALEKDASKFLIRQGFQPPAMGGSVAGKDAAKLAREIAQAREEMGLARGLQPRPGAPRLSKDVPSRRDPLPEVSAFEEVSEPLRRRTEKADVRAAKRAAVAAKKAGIAVAPVVAKVAVPEKITRAYVRRHADKVFVFGDNDERRGFGGQAQEMRGEPNAMGIRTKKSPKMGEEAFYTDAEYAENVRKIDEDIAAVRATGRTVVVPKAGVGTGLAKMAEKAPRTFAYLQERLKELGVGKRVAAPVAPTMPAPLPTATAAPSPRASIAEALTRNHAAAAARKLKPKFSSAMEFVMPPSERNPGVTASNTFDAILLGQRSATTRQGQNIPQWENAKPGDVVRFTSGKGRGLMAEIEQVFKVNFDTMKEQSWQNISRREGWTVEHMKRAFVGKGLGYHIRYKLIQ